MFMDSANLDLTHEIVRQIKSGFIAQMSRKRVFCQSRGQVKPRRTADAITSAIGNPIHDHKHDQPNGPLGISKKGKTCVATCMISQPPATATL